MFLVSIYVRIFVIFIVIVVFLLSVILNQRTKVPKDIEMPEKCQFCPSKTCVIKISEVEKKQEELKAYLESCEVSDDKKEE